LGNSAGAIWEKERGGQGGDEKIGALLKEQEKDSGDKKGQGKVEEKHEKKEKFALLGCGFVG